ncbi:hypothetical protein ACFZCG_32650 [Streptomyces tanashiensis]|uniref:hypothetical protein n=1 Tax=Streptomyces tanashiensis TaxID=67367 RepID=UPI0036E2DC3B
MNEQEHRRRRRRSRTTPAHAEGESGDREAREAVTGRAGDTDTKGADGHRSKRQSPGAGREEQNEEQR